MKKFAETLAKEHELVDMSYYEYILVSLVNGQRQQCRNLFNKMHKDDKEDFLINFLEDDNGIQTSCKNTCIGELIQEIN